jgi:preprotein translocase subunit YajC
MNSARWRIGLLLFVLVLIVVAVVILRNPDQRSAKRHSPELEYLKAVNSVTPPKDPELMFILMGEFASSSHG